MVLFFTSKVAAALIIRLNQLQQSTAAFFLFSSDACPLLYNTDAPRPTSNHGTSRPFAQSSLSGRLYGRRLARADTSGRNAGVRPLGPRGPDVATPRRRRADR